MIVSFLMVSLASLLLSQEYRASDYVIEVEKKIGLELLGLINGYQYVPSPTVKKSHAFLFTSQWEKTDLFVNNQVYENVLFKYDLFKNELVIAKNLASGALVPVVISLERVDGFKVNSKEFKRVLIDSQYRFCEVIYQGNAISLFKSYEKKSEVNLDVHSVVYVEKNELYFLYNGETHHVKNKNDLLSFFPDNKKKVKQFIQTQKIKIKTNNPDGLAHLMKYCNAL